MDGDGEREYPEPPKLRRSTEYDPRVLRYNWQLLALAEPRDDENFLPPKGNLHKSSYRRLGPEKDESWLTETRERMEEIHSRGDYVSVYPRRSTLNMFSYSLTEDEERKEVLRSTGLKLYPYNYGCTDYRTTSKIEHPLHFPIQPRPQSSKDQPWLLYRRTLSYSDGELARRDCNEKFFDEGMERHDEIAAMKIERYRSYDPVGKKFTDPCRLAVYKEKKKF